MNECAEKYAAPAYKWIGAMRKVKISQGFEICNFPGGIGFKVENYSREKKLIVLLSLHREDGACEQYIMRACYVGQWERDFEKWQTHQLVLFPYESPHGQVNIVTFSYLIHVRGHLLTSEYEYKFARREDFFRERVEPCDFHEPYFKRPNHYAPYQHTSEEIHHALASMREERNGIPVRAFFTRGDPGSPEHPCHEIHRALDGVLELQSGELQRRHYVHLAIFNFENENIVNHLLHLNSCGIQVECVGGWEQTSSADWSHQVARLRKAGIPVYGVVRNTPYNPCEGIASMHTKIIIFDGQQATSSSYNLDFHRWGQNWENGLFFYSPPVSLLYEHVYQVIKGAIFRGYQVAPEAPYNLYYSFGKYYDPDRRQFTPSDALLREIYMASSSIFISMFDMEDFVMRGNRGFEVRLTKALIDARNRGVYIVIHLNGFKAEQENAPVREGELRPLKPIIEHLLKNSIEVLLIYYHHHPYSPLHHKFAVFDEHTVITESYNWYSASLYSDEVFSVIRDKSLASSFIHEMYLMLKYFRIRKGGEVFV